MYSADKAPRLAAGSPTSGGSPAIISVSDVLASLSHRDEARIKWIAFCAAVVIHLVLLSVNFPEMRQAIQPKPSGPVLVVRKYIPPPPRVERPTAVTTKRFTRRVPIPDPTPDEPEPIREPEPVVEQPLLPPDVELLIGVPEPPPPRQPSEPLLAGVGEVTMPELIPESKISPVYPDVARLARVEGNVILQAVIHADGSVGNIEVLRCNRPHMGFEDSAVAAVRQWRYKPAMQNGRAVDVYFTVFVDFELI